VTYGESNERLPHVTLKDQTRYRNTLKAHISKTAGGAIYQQSLITRYALFRAFS